MAQVPQVVIIGGGFAGLAAARQLRHVECEVTIIDRHNHHGARYIPSGISSSGSSSESSCATIPRCA